jgi:prolipoprotein diacylglyceryltransferase
MKKTFLKYLIFYGILFFLVNFFNVSNIGFLKIVEIVLISILCGGVLSIITVLLKINFVKENKNKLRNSHKKF